MYAPEGIAAQAAAAPGTDTPKELARKALDANKAHQLALTKYAEQLTAELQEVERLLSAATTDDGEDEPERDVQVFEAKKAIGPCAIAEFLNPDSPFYEEASRRSRYLSYTAVRPMKAKELEALAEAVKAENQRLRAYEAQRRGNGTLPSDIDINLEHNVEGLDWSVIAEKVSNSANVRRTPNECRIKWLGDRHPAINHDEWTATEIDQLNELVAAGLEVGKVDWVDVAKKLGTNRSPIECMRRGLPRQRHLWNHTSDQKLFDAVQRYGTDNWNLVARYVSEDATAAQCQGRYYRTLPTLRRGSWSEEEDARLKLAVAGYGHSWVDVATAIPGRTNEQCRERWSEQINMPSTKNRWTEEEDEALLDAVGTIGNQWKIISAKIGNGRTGQNCRLRYDKLKKSRGEATLSGARKKKAVAAAGPNHEGTDVPASKPRPKPIPVGKGKGKAKDVDPEADVAAIDPEEAEETVNDGDAIGIDHVESTKGRKRGATRGHDDDAPPAKKRRTRQTSDVEASDAQNSPTPDENEPKRVATRTAGRKRGRQPQKHVQTHNEDEAVGAEPPSKIHEESISHEQGDANGTEEVAAGASKPKPRPRGRPKKVTAPPVIEDGTSVENQGATAAGPSTQPDAITAKGRPRKSKIVPLTPRRQSARVAAKQGNVPAEAERDVPDDTDTDGPTVPIPPETTANDDGVLSPMSGCDDVPAPTTTAKPETRRAVDTTTTDSPSGPVADGVVSSELIRSL